MPPSSSSPASASLPRTRHTPPRVCVRTRKSSPCPVARATASARRGMRVGARRTDRDRAPHPRARPRHRGAGRARRRTANQPEPPPLSARDVARSAAPIIESASAVQRAPPRSGARLRAVSLGSLRVGRFVHRVVPRAPEAVQGELDHQRHGFGRAPVGEALERGRQARAGLLVPSEELSTPAQARASLARIACASSGTIASASSRALVAVVEVAGRRQRIRTGEQELDALLRRRGLAGGDEAPLRTSVRRSPAPAARLPRRPRAGRRRRRGRPGGPTARRGARAPPPTRPAPRAPRRTARGRPAASRRRGLVDRAADERMPEAEAPGHVRRANEVEPQELVERLDRRLPRVPAAAAASSGSNGSPATAAPSSTRRAASESSASSSLSEAATADGTPMSVERASHSWRRRRAVERPRELLEIERVAAALLVEAAASTVDRVAEQLSGLGGRQRAELDAGQHAGALRPLERGRRAARAADGDGPPARGAPRGRRPAEQRAEQLDRRRVGPVEVIEHEHERLRRRELLEQRAHRAVAAVALVLERRARARSRAWIARGRRARAPSGRHRRGLRGESGSSPLDVLVERIDEDRERQVSLELRRRAREDEVPAGVRASRRALRADASCRSPAHRRARSRPRRPCRARRGRDRASRAPRRARRGARSGGPSFPPGAG